MYISTSFTLQRGSVVQVLLSYTLDVFSPVVQLQSPRQPRTTVRLCTHYNKSVGALLRVERGDEVAPIGSVDAVSG